MLKLFQNITCDLLHLRKGDIILFEGGSSARVCAINITSSTVYIKVDYLIGFGPNVVIPYTRDGICKDIKYTCFNIKYIKKEGGVSFVKKMFFKKV